MGKGPLVSVVIATRNRAPRLEAAIASLRAQTLPADRYELVVVDDGSTDGTADLLAREAARDGIRLVPVIRGESGGPGAARNAGWRAAQGQVIAFTDDDCVADPRWLEAGLAEWGGDPERFVQGATVPIEEELGAMGPFSYTIDLRWQVPEFPTCNMFYPRELLERVGGFDVEAFSRPAGEDTDLAWRVRAAGGRPAFAADAVVRHAVVTLGPIGFLRRNWSWGDAMPVFVRHPQLRRERLHHRIFWNYSHWLLLRLYVALALPWRRSLVPLKLWLGFPYIRYRLPHPRDQRSSIASMLWFVLADTVEMVSVARAGVRSRTLIL